MITTTASGKIILCGEHAVVYGRPAIAVPVTQVGVRVTIEENATGLLIHAVDLDGHYRYSELDPSQPLGAIIRLALSALGDAAPPNAALTIHSTIPIASGLGSGTAVSTAIVRALAKYFGRELDIPTVSALVYEVEKLHHGTPSGIDNTVIAFGQPVYFARDKTLQPFPVPTPFRLVIADTGIASPTKIAVGDVRRAWEADHDKYESLFDRCGEIAKSAFDLIQTGQPNDMGPMLTYNHRLLSEMGVSSPELDVLVNAALDGGALGAKLSGGGRGGNMIALVTVETAAEIEQALLNAGAKRVITTVIG
ncbi:MAG TPA: mevalonate kinase [Anaerolineales bacterium]|nr:mevalonate kinase [Anaerolineales bacterium]